MVACSRKDEWNDSAIPLVHWRGATIDRKLSPSNLKKYF